MKKPIDKRSPKISAASFAGLLIESMAEGVFTVGSSGCISSWNPAMKKITGYSGEDVIGKTCGVIGFNLCSGKQCPSSINECDIFKQGKLDGKECYLRHKQGHLIAVVKSARVFRDKDGNVCGVVETITDMTDLYQARKIAEEATRKLGELHSLDRIIGKSRAIQSVFSSIKASASSEATILIQGESGTGKELVAGAIHYNSRRVDGPFKAINCSSLSESLLESELFGHVKGAFTGAYQDRTGYFEEADGGTLFLDEIGEISPYIQIKLLRVIQEREFERVGESKKRKIDIRIIAATNRNLTELVKNGSFREDLYYRLKVFPIQMPALSERKDDLPLLISHFIASQNQKTGKSITGVTQLAMRRLLDYHWPGNVRELENAVEHGFVLCETTMIDIPDLPIEIREDTPAPSEKEGHTDNSASAGSGKQKLTREALIIILKDGHWNKAEAARRTGFSRAAIWKYMRKWGIPLKEVDFNQT